ISRQRRFASELAERVAMARRELEELDRAKSAFVAIASHELRTPLTALQGFSEILAVRRLPPEEVTRLAEVMRREARRLGRIVSDLLDLSPTGSAVHVGARALDGTVAIEVADAGRGIPADALGRIFEPYYRVPDAAGAARGTGIGLAVVKALVEAHGGTVHVESAPALGTRVTVLLPSCAAAIPGRSRSVP